MMARFAKLNGAPVVFVFLAGFQYRSAKTPADAVVRGASAFRLRARQAWLNESAVVRNFLMDRADPDPALAETSAGDNS